MKTHFTFLIPSSGVHHIHLYWSDTPLVKSPFTGYATTGAADPSKVILTGRGLKEAIVREEAEFLIDASQAGEGKLAYICLATDSFDLIYFWVIFVQVLV